LERRSPLKIDEDLHLIGPDHKTITICREGHLQVFDLETGKSSEKFSGHYQLASLAYSADGKQLVTIGLSRLPALWDISTGKSVELPQCLDRDVATVALAVDGKTVAAAMRGSSIVRVVDRKTSTDVPALHGHVGAIQHLALSPDGKTLVTVAKDWNVFLWDATNGKEIRHLDGAGGWDMRLFAGTGDYGTTIFSARRVALSPDGKQFAVTSSFKEARLYDTATGDKICAVRDHSDSVADYAEDVAFAPDGKSLAGLCNRRNIRYWDSSTGKEQDDFLEKSQAASDAKSEDDLLRLAFSHDGKSMVTLSVNEIEHGTIACVLHVWELTTGKHRQRIRLEVPGGLDSRLSFENGDVHTGIALSPDDRFVAVTSGTTVHLVDLGAGKEIRAFGGKREMLSPAVFSPDGKTLAAGASDGTIRLWDVATGSDLGQFSGHRGAVTCLAYAPNGKTLITGSADGTAMVWDVSYLSDAIQAERKPLARARLESQVKQLAVDDVEKADKAMWNLTRAGNEAVSVLKEHLKPVALPNEKKLKQLIQDLGSDDFDARKQATEELEQLGELAEPSLRKRLEEKPELEVQKRIDELIERLEKWQHGPVTSPDRLSALRMIEVLEHIGTTEARKLLEDVSKGAEAGRVTRDAKDAVERLSGK
jgi:WD40 repeat protein